MSLRKSGTFSSPKTANDLCDLENQYFMPRRSPTSTERLEELLQDSIQDPSVRRVANLLRDFDQKIAGHRAASTASADILNDPEVLPVPSFVLDNASLDSTPMEIDPKPSTIGQNPHEHASDSGLGTSISGSKYENAHTRRSSVRGSISTSISSTRSAVTRSCSTLNASEGKHTLGEYACKQIHDHIIKPILAEDSLKEFHTLIQDVPRRIGEKNICNLRDLEKTLIFLAPELSTTSASYLRFCERSIQLLVTTVDYLPERDQRLPSDRPYTNGYFLDLIEQIRRYAAIMAATREKQETGQELNDQDYSRDEKITLRGGLSHDGRPLELVREKNGQVVNLAESADACRSVSKRGYLADEMDEDEVTRSMARRRKSEKPGDVMHVCRDCNKEFKRPCDLTKHEKTHSRPWKCSEQECKYFELGWPTEKERDRHMNDRHSAAPAQYKCHYPPCTYASKRESNCKQHMEKAHGWEYVRSKNNGRKKGAMSNDVSPTTPLTPFLGTPRSVALNTPITPFLTSPQTPFVGDSEYYGFGTPALSMQGDFRRGSVSTDETHFTHSSGHSPTEPTSFVDAVSLEDTSIDHNDVFNNCSLGTTFTAGLQQPTPALSTTFAFEPLPFTAASTMNPGFSHLSPLAQPNVTLLSPHINLDEGFGDMDMDLSSFGRPTEDFTLFDTVPPTNMSLSNTANFFPDFHQLGGQFDNFYTEPTTTLDDLMNPYGSLQ